eukprot:1158313-Pelagomonas_calceolata.AAC.9
MITTSAQPPTKLKSRALAQARFLASTHKTTQLRLCQSSILLAMLILTASSTLTHASCAQDPPDKQSQLQAPHVAHLANDGI